MEQDNDNSNSRDQINDESRIVQKQLFWYDFQNFPDSLLIHILARLPVKWISMFKCVCKHWQTLISNPFFCRFYYSIRNPNSNLNFNSNSNSNSNSNTAVLPFRILKRYAGVSNIEEFVNRLGPEINSSSSESSLLFPSSPIGIQQRLCVQLKVLDISNGLILCCPTSLVYYICDPLTRIWITIPRSGPAVHERFWEGLITRVNEDHMLTGYTVVRLNPLKSRFFYLTLDMFSSETGKWIEHRVPSYIPFRLRDMDGGPIHCYGALHWPVSLDTGIHAMLAFDPYKDPKSVRIIPFPEDRSSLVDEHYSMRMWFQLCGEFQGALRYFEVSCYRMQFNFLGMWTMKDYEKGEWCCEFKVGFSDLHSGEDLDLSNWSLGRLCPLSFHPFNQNVVYLWCMETKRIVSYDVLNRRLDVASEPYLDIWQSVSTAHIIPFVLPRWPALLFQLPLSFNSKVKGKKCRK